MTQPPHSEDAIRAAGEYLQQRIPLTRAMGLQVSADAAHGFAVEAPVALNYNHLHTAFGGSINAVATLAGYVFLWLELQSAEAHVVVASSCIRFLHPVRENIRAVCLQPAARELDEFRDNFRANGKARMKLQVRVEENGNAAAEFEGTFVALRNQKPEQ
jgi:thioesterase domain-containing protein